MLQHRGKWTGPMYKRLSADPPLEFSRPFVLFSCDGRPNGKATTIGHLSARAIYDTEVC
jgi:hypothetical protein